MKHYPRLFTSSLLVLACLTANLRAEPDWVGSAGAKLPFITHEAESPGNITTGRVVRLATGDGAPSPALEASGRAYVELDATGQTLSIRATAAADSIVLRNCIPDAPGGGGITASLSLYVNGAFRQKLTLGSRNNWLYGTELNRGGNVVNNAQSNTPGPGPHVFWDEARAFIKGGIKSGDTLSLRKEADDTAAYYRIDLVDLELVGPPLPPPAAGTFLSVTDFGAVGTDDKDDTAAILAAIAAAKAQGKIVWIPAGDYYQSSRFELEGVVVRGAGPWYTRILGTNIGKNWVGTMGFNLAGNGPQLSDLYLESMAHVARLPGGKAITGNARNWVVRNVWITHTNVGLWMSGASHGEVRDCRVRFTYADGINLNRGASDNLVENNHVRGCGDDGIALLSETGRKDPPSRGNTVRRNTVSAIWWGHNVDLAGGADHVVEYNLLADNSLAGVLTLNLTPSYPNYPLSNSVVRRNVLLRGGGNFAGQKRGAFWIFAGNTGITDVRVEENFITRPIFRGIQMTGPSPQVISFVGNTIEYPGEDAIYVDANVTGSGTFSHNRVTGLSAGYQAVANHAGNAYKVIAQGNDW